MTGTTGLEPATSDVTGRRSNQLSYVPAYARAASWASPALPQYAKASHRSALPLQQLASIRNWPTGQFSTRLRLVPLTGPPPLLDTHPLSSIFDDLRSERAATVAFPPGETNFSLRRTRRFADNPLPLLLDAYERFGPVFTLRLFHGNVVFMLGPAANHYLTVSHASNFIWRDSHFRDLIGLMGDGLLTIDGDFHRRSRRIMLPAFHRDHIAASVETMVEETTRALDQLAPGATFDLYTWTRHLAMRIALRALFGLDPDRGPARAIDAAGLFEQALSFFAADYALRVLRGPFTPWARLQQAARKLDTLIYSEISSRRASGARGQDVLSLLLDAEDEDGHSLSDLQVRDEVMTLLFAGHDTTTSTVSFMFYELARHPAIVARLHAEQDALLPDGRPTAAQLTSGELSELELVLDETLRKYPPAWIGPRRSIEPFEFEGVTVPGRSFVNYSSWASHHLPDVFADPEEFRPERFAPDARATLPKGAYVPFGGGSRTCIGMRFGQLEVRTIATLILSRFTLDLPEDFALTIRQMPTISPKQGLPMTVSPRSPSVTSAPPADLSAVT
jgi:cytochrome P450